MEAPLPAEAWALARQLLARCTFPAPDAHVVAAVSGGADSLALLILARRAGLEVTALHVDHGLRPGSAAEADGVADVAARLGAGFRGERVEVAPGSDLEARARALRYAVLPAGVLTGHTAEDQAETVLLNLIRGAGVPGLAGMTPRALERADGGRWVRRPLLGLRRAETEALCQVAGLTPLRDPSNRDPRFVRNRIRHQLLPLLADIGERDPVPILARQAAVIADDAALLDELGAQLDPTDARALAAAPLPLARRAVREWLRRGADAERHPPSAAEVARVLAVAQGTAVACEVSGGRRVARTRGRLRLEGPAS